MPLGFECLYEPGEAESEDQLVDVVAVHDVCEEASTAWTDTESGINWLKDLLPHHIRICRVITYSYDANVESFFSDDAPERLQRLAESLVQELRANRQFAGSSRRPIVFVCHGLGGVLVKKSLIYSATRTAPKVVHLWDQFVSTFAILFFGTPHAKTSRANWLALEQLSRQDAAFRAKSLFRSKDQTPPSHGVHVQVCQAIDKEFAPLIKQFRVFSFWEGSQTNLGGRFDYVVDSESATLKVDNTENAGIPATHSGMTKFASARDSNYRTTVAALATYCEQAPAIISHRWSQAENALKQLRAGEAWELGGFGFDVHSEEPYRTSDIPIHRYFHPPQETTPLFIGREILLSSLKAAFFAPASSKPMPGRKSFVICGMGGSGKTQLCSKFAADNRHRYEAVFTIRAASAKTISDSFSRIGRLAELEPTESAGRHFLSQLKEPWLLIIDNADDPSSDLTSLFPLGETAHIIITTRNPDFRQEGTVGFLELKGLEEDEALRLLLTKANIPRPWDKTTAETGKAITKALGCLALALIQAGNCIFRKICKIGEYLKLYRVARGSLTKQRRVQDNESEDENIIKVVYSTFDVSLTYMKTQSLRSRDASELLNILSFFHFEGVPRELFSRAVNNRLMELPVAARPFSGAGLLEGLAKRFRPPEILPGFLKGNSESLNEFRVNWAIGELQSLSLISVNEKHISMHPLIHAWARDRLSLPEQRSWAAIAFRTAMEATALPPASSSEKDGSFHADLLPHLEACMQSSENEQPIKLEFKSRSNLHRTITQLILPTKFLILGDQARIAAKLGYVYAERGQFDRASFYLEAVRATLLQILGEENEKTMIATKALAGMYWGLDRLSEAIALQRRLAEMRTQLQGPNHEETLRSMDALGKSYWLHGSYKESLDILTQATDRMRVHFGPSDPRYPDTLAALDNLGVTLGAWRRYHESLKILLEVYAARKKLYGEKHQDALWTNANVAMALLELGRLDEATTRMTQVYEQRQIQLGKEHPWTLWALIYLCKVHIAAGRLNLAEELLTWGIEAGRRSLPDGHVGICLGRGELSRIYARQGRLEEAEELLAMTLKHIETSRGKAHPDVVYAGFKMAQLHMIQGKRDQATFHCHQSLQRTDLRLGKTHPLGQDLIAMLKVLMDPSVSTEDLATFVPGPTSKFGLSLTSDSESETVLEETKPPDVKILKTTTW